MIKNLCHKKPKLMTRNQRRNSIIISRPSKICRKIQYSDLICYHGSHGWICTFHVRSIHKEYSGVEEQSQRSVVKKVASVRLAWSGTFARGTHATKKFAWQEAKSKKRDFAMQTEIVSTVLQIAPASEVV